MDDFIIPLHLLPSGQSATVYELIGAGEIVHRLEEMGLRSGTKVEVAQSGSPCIIHVGNHKLCFRDSDACNVLVRPDGEV